MLTIDYAHIVAYFEEHVASPLDALSEVTRRIERTFPMTRTEFFVLVKSRAEFPEDWKRSPDGGYVTLHSKTEDAGQLLSSLDQLPLADSEVVSTVFSSPRKGTRGKLVDYNWCVHYGGGGEYATSQLDPQLTISLRLNDFDRDTEGLAASRSLIDDLVTPITSRGDKLYYLLVDVATHIETGADGVYQSTSMPAVGPRSLARAVERSIWEDLRQRRRNFVRGVFWGNYFNPTLLERLGGKEDFRERYMAKAKSELANIQTLVRDTPAGGLLVKISRDPLDELRTAHLGVEMAVWLRRELQRIGALI